MSSDEGVSGANNEAMGGSWRMRPTRGYRGGGHVWIDSEEAICGAVDIVMERPAVDPAAKQETDRGDETRDGACGGDANVARGRF